MGLSHELISQFAKLVTEERKTDNGTIVYGIVVDEDGQKYVRLDGSTINTPITEEDDLSKTITSSTADVKDGDRVSVLLKNHTATITGNISSPAARTGDLTEIREFGIAVGKKVTANEAYFKKLMADEATLGKLEAAEISVTDLIAKKAEIEKLVADKITVTDLIAKKIDTDVVIADKALIDKLVASKASVIDLIADKATIEDLIAKKASIGSLMADKLDVTWANIDFANIDIATIGKLFTEAGIIKDIVTESGTVTGELVGVTIKGDLVEAGTLKADRLVVKGSDGNYYALNTDFEAMPGVTPVEEDAIHGSVLIKKSIAAEKISVSDLVAFDATIGGFQITDTSINSVTKPSVDSNTRGVYLDNDGQVAFGDAERHIKFYKDPPDPILLDADGYALCDEDGAVLTDEGEGVYRLAIVADEITIGTTDVGTRIENLTDDTNNLKSSVQNNAERLEENNANIDKRLIEVEKAASLSVTKAQVEIAIEETLSTNGASKLKTKTGHIFDDEGMTVYKSDSEMKTQITNDGMTVYKKTGVDIDGKDAFSETLVANSEGVDAVDLKASTYLIIGGRSRFQNYTSNGKKRTACFWLGG